MRGGLDDLGLIGMLGGTLGSYTSQLLAGHNQRFSRITVGKTDSHTSWWARCRLGDGRGEWRSSVA
jgi:hypothetical protein